MNEVEEGNLKFIFNKNVKVLNYDEKDSFYIKQFQSILLDNESNHQNTFDKICESYKKKEFKKVLKTLCPKSISAVDMIAYNENIAYFIEVKDYRNFRTEDRDFNKLILTIIKNCLDSYSGIIGMQFSKKSNEKEIAREILSKEYIEFIFHVELPNESNKFDKEVWNLATIYDSIDRRNNFSSRIRVVSKDNLPDDLPWNVKDINATS